MRTVWKWVIGIAVVLVVLAVFVGGIWVLRNNFAAMPRFVQNAPRTNPVPNAPSSPNVPNGQNPYYGGPRGMMPYGGRGYPGMPMMRSRGFGILPFIGIFGFLFFVGLLVLIVLGIIWLVRRQSRPAMVSSGASATTVPPTSTVATHACANCGQPVQNGWEYCPNCGTKQ